MMTFYYGEDITNVSSGSWNDAEWVPFNGLGLEGADWLGANWNAETDHHKIIQKQ